LAGFVILGVLWSFFFAFIFAAGIASSTILYPLPDLDFIDFI
jgi:hypothetical protein